MTAFNIPTKPKSQSLTVSLAGVTYIFVLRWNPIASYWVLDIYDENNDPLAQGLPLITGADLTAQLRYLEIQGYLFAQTDSDANAVPTYQNLGSTGHLYFVTPPL